jgi:hypothetical protein
MELKIKDAMSTIGLAIAGVGEELLGPGECVGGGRRGGSRRSQWRSTVTCPTDERSMVAAQAGAYRRRARRRWGTA